MGQYADNQVKQSLTVFDTKTIKYNSQYAGLHCDSKQCGGKFTYHDTLIILITNKGAKYYHKDCLC